MSKSPLEGTTAEHAVLEAGSRARFQNLYCPETIDGPVCPEGATVTGQSEKKRKLDKDGFSVPGLPVLPKYSAYNPDETDETEYQAVTTPVLEHAQHETDLSPTEECEKGATILDSAPHDNKEEVHYDPSKCVAELLKDAEEESSSLHRTWAQCFSDSEKFETFCRENFEALFEEAKTLEETMLKEKEQLRQRLQVLSKTLQNLT